MLYDLNSAFALLGETIRKFSPGLTISDLAYQPNKFFSYLGKVFANTEKAEVVINSGWVPYPGISLAGIKKDLSSIVVHRRIRDITARKWTSIRQEMLQAVDASGVDNEALATFEEALAAYDAGLYRSVVRVILPELERVAREEYGEAGASFKYLREAIDHLPAGVPVDENSGYALIKVLKNHLYVHTSTYDLDALARDPIPNRHAAIHGVVSYSSRQNAFNALALACFIFPLVMRVRAYANA